MKQMLNPKTKNILLGIAVVIFLAVFAIWMFAGPKPDHIEDTNGGDNYALQTITQQDVVAMEMGARGSIQEHEVQYSFAGLNISDGIRYSSEKFTGVQMIYMTTILKGSDILVDLAEFEITEGNFAFYVVLDDEVIGQIVPDENGMAEFLMENIEKTGELRYIVAGESASFTFTVPADFQ